MARLVFNAAFMVCLIYAVLLVIAAAMPESKHNKWHDKDGK